MNKQEIYNKLNTIFTSRRTSAQTLAYQNLLKARKSQKFVELERKIKELTFDLGKANAFGSAEEAQSIKNELIKSQIAQEKLLVAFGMSSQSLIPQYQCQNCHDTGRRNGILCDCYKKELYSLLLENSGSKTNLAHFEDFNENLISNSEQKAQLLKLKAKFEDWVNEYPNTKTHTFLFCGSTGVGKTFMTECIAHAMINKGYLVSFISAFGLNQNFLKYHTEKNENKNIYWDALVEPELLVIDDLGTEPMLKNVTINYLCSLLSDRFERGKATIISTNLDLDQLLNRYGDRIFSRIANKADSEMFKIAGEDLRLKKR